MAAHVCPRPALVVTVLLALPAPLLATTTTLSIGAHDFLLTGGASVIPGHGAPTGASLRTGDPGQVTAASFPKLVLAPGATITALSLDYRYVSGYGQDGAGHGTNLSLLVSDDVMRVGRGTVVYTSPHYTDHSYAHNSSNYSAPIPVRASGLSIRASEKGSTRLQLAFWNNDRNLQLLVPLQVNVTCEGTEPCFVPAPTPAPLSPLPPLPPAVTPPATHTPWTMVGPWNIGDDVHGAGEAGTIAPAVSPTAHPNVMYMGGNNNAASSGVLKTIDGGHHWTKVAAATQPPSPPPALAVLPSRSLVHSTLLGPPPPRPAAAPLAACARRPHACARRRSTPASSTRASTAFSLWTTRGRGRDRKSVV